jgi:hypothetical protein
MDGVIAIPKAVYLVIGTMIVTAAVAGGTVALVVHHNDNAVVNELKREDAARKSDEADAQRWMTQTTNTSKN